MTERNGSVNLVDELAEEFARRWRAGENPSVEEYAARHPECAEVLRAALAAVSIMERLKPGREDACLQDAWPLRRDRIPKRIGEFAIVREIGRGGMGVVYEAYQETLGRQVALKLLGGHLVHDEKLRQRFGRESRAAARLHHTNIVPVFGVGESEGQCFYGMQLIQGRGLDLIIKDLAADPSNGAGDFNSATTDRQGPMPRRAAEDSRTGESLLAAGQPVPQAPSGATEQADRDDQPEGEQDAAPFGPRLSHLWRTVAGVGVQVADALAYSHSCGVLHRDVKPSNLLLDARGAVWVTDFGVAKLLEEANLTQSGEFAGTLKYMPPERFSGRSDARGDVYSLGVTLYELLTLRPAFPETSPQHLILRIEQGAPPPPRRLNAGIPPDLETIVLKAMARDPDQRYQTAGELAEDLRRFLDDRPIVARKSGPFRRTWRWCRRNAALATAMAVAFAMMMAVTVVSVSAYARTAVASRQVATANAEMENALASEKLQREHAENVSDLALEALNRTYERFAPNRLVVTPPASNEEGIEAPAPPALTPEAVPLLEDLLHTYERIARTGGEFPGLQLRVAEANHRIGDICQRLGRLEDAVNAYRMAIDLYARPHPGSEEVADRIKLARACNELGRTLRSLRKFDEARRMHERAIAVLADAPASFAGRPECRYELARSYYTLGRRDMFGTPPHGDRPPPPREFGAMPPGPGFGPPPFGEPPPRFGREAPEDQPCRRAVAVLEDLVREFPTVPEYRHLLACCYRDMPPEWPGSGPGPGRQPSFANRDRAVELLRQLVADFPKVPDYLFDLCETLGRPGRPGRPGGDTDAEARSTQRLQEAISASAELIAKYANVPEYTAAHVRYLSDLGIVSYRAGKFDEAEKLQRKARAIQSKLVKQYPEVGAYRFWLSMIEHALAKVLAKRGEWQEARQRLESASARVEALRQADPKFGPAPGFLGMIYRDLAAVLDASGETALAAESLGKAETLRKAGGPGFPGPRDPIDTRH
jgi:eukaryotic-like serine/threonine-protein kinase